MSKIAQISRHVWRVATLCQLADNAHTGGCRQPLQFFERILGRRMIGQNDAHKHSRFAGHTFRAVEFNHDRDTPRW